MILGITLETCTVYTVLHIEYNIDYIIRCTYPCAKKSWGQILGSYTYDITQPLPFRVNV